MYCYWIPIAILLLIGLFSDGNTWSPFQSDQVKVICSHMTKAERRTAMKRGMLCGLLIAVIPGPTLVLGMMVFRSVTVFMAVCFLVYPVLALVFWRKWLPNVVKSQQDFFASTEWARSQGIRAEDVRLYRWQR